MPLEGYGVLVARATDRRREGARDTPHYHVRVGLSDGPEFRIAINVLSRQAPAELRYLVDDDFSHPITGTLAGLGDGWHPLASRPGGSALDFIRGNLFDPGALRLLPPDLSGPDNDLADIFDHYVQRAITDDEARVFAFGQRWPTEHNVPDQVFGFSPGNGVHDIHMNQGNSSGFQQDDGVWQDGGLLLHFPRDKRWVAVFLAFQSQSWHTDDKTGHALDGGPAAEADAAVVRVLAALVNPIGSPEEESVVLINASPEPVDLAGWQLSDRSKARTPVPAQVLPPGATISVPLHPGNAVLGNKGGQITLLDAAGLKVHGVSYTAKDAREGWMVVF